MEMLLLVIVVFFCFEILVFENLFYGDVIVRLLSFFVLEIIWNEILESIID